MNKLLLTISIFTIVASCETNHGVVKYDDPKTDAIGTVFEYVSNEDNSYLEEIFSKDMFMVNPANDTLYYDDFLSGIENMYDLFDDIKFDTADGSATADEVETNYYTNGQVWAQIWSSFEATGKYTGEKVSFPFHIAYKWDGDKIIEEYQFFDMTVFKNEEQAKINSLNN